MANKPGIPKGTRDFSPSELQKREFIFNTVRGVFQLYGYQQIETPAMENLTTLLGKYGDEGDRLIFRILNSGDFLSAVSEEEISTLGSARLSQKICEKGLRYDLTVPFARYVVQHREEIVFPFRRYQIQPVWRADRPQKGRYREFFQCDADVIGSDSLLNEYELIRIIDDVFEKLNLSVQIKVNNRKVLAGIAEYIGESARITDITVAIDKLEKIGIEAVNDELREKGVSEDAVRKLQPVFELKGPISSRLSGIAGMLAGSETGLQGISELQTLFSFMSEGSLSADVDLDLTLARGLNYYTGAIIEVKAADVAIGSICGGGRYDDLTGIFGLPGVSGVGISFGADRIYDVMEKLNLFEKVTGSPADVLIINFGGDELKYALRLAAMLRAAGIKTAFYPDAAKLKKQMSYADSSNIPVVIIAGEGEIKAGEVTLKIMSTGEQRKVSPGDIPGELSKIGI
ncbi:MAG: histidine--tRNA ligase [Bacteroidales bacterium]|nr:histidine--tRNA ligase [Bacteroidales bacterium]MBN2632702.1 histidine--tRNA ligase [Bacteroidales bacterium]